MVTDRANRDKLAEQLRDDFSFRCLFRLISHSARRHFTQPAMPRRPQRAAKNPNQAGTREIIKVLATDEGDPVAVSWDTLRQEINCFSFFLFAWLLSHRVETSTVTRGELVEGTKHSFVCSPIKRRRKKTKRENHSESSWGGLMKSLVSLTRSCKLIKSIWEDLEISDRDEKSSFSAMVD